MQILTEYIDTRAVPALAPRVRLYGFSNVGWGIDFQNQLSRAALYDDGTVRCWAVRMYTNGAVNAGEVVTIDQASSDRVVICPTAGNSRQMPVGVAMQSQSGSQWIYVAVSGVCLVLPEAAVTAAAGYIIYTSTATAGRVAQSAGIPAGVPDHNSEVGHYLRNGTGAGVATLAAIHFN